jgi:hypothetical protein
MKGDTILYSKAICYENRKDNIKEIAVGDLFTRCAEMQKNHGELSPKNIYL